MSVFRYATHFAYKNNLTIINKYLVKYSTPGSIGSSKGIFLLTESHFFLFEQNKNKLIFMTSWKNINAISVEESKISLTFLINNRDRSITDNVENKKFVLWSSQSDLKCVEIKSKIFVLLQRTLSRSELTMLKIKDFNEPIYYPTPRSPIARFRMWDILNDPSYNIDMPVFAEIHKKLVYSLVFRDVNLQLNNLPQSEKILPIYLDMLKVAPQVQQLRVPMIPARKTYDFIIDLLVNNDYLQYLEISGKCQKDFFYLIKAIKDNKNSGISSLSFVNTQFTINELTLLYDFIVNGSNINALEFHSSILPEAVDYFYSSFLTPILCEKLAILNLDQSPGVNIEKLFPKVTNISMLSLEGCDVELSEVFNCLAQGTAIGLRELNISRCYVKNVPSEDLPQFSRNFQKLIINEVSWPSGTLVPFFQFYLSHFRRVSNQQTAGANTDPDFQNLLSPSLYFSNEIAETDEWLSLFDYLATVENYRDLVALGWNGNPVHKNLFNFLKENFHLKTLMMSCCFSEECPEAINDLCAFIASTTSFTTLIVSGNEINHFGKYTVNVLRALMNHQAVKKLDISFSYGGDETVAAILPLIQNNMPLEMIDFDAVYCQKTNDLVNLMRSLRQRRSQIRISFPTVEFTRLKNDKLISKEIFDEITHLYKIPLEGESGSRVSFHDQLEINVSDQNLQAGSAKKRGKDDDDDDDDDLPYIPPNQILAKNYCIYKHFNPPDFPCIVSKAMFEEIRKQTRLQKSIGSPRRENDSFSRSAFSRTNSPRASTPTTRNIDNAFDDENDEKIWPRSQKDIVDAKNNLKSTLPKERNTPESTKSPKSLDVFDDEPVQPKSPKQISTKPSRQNSKVVKRKGKRASRSKRQVSDEDEEDFDDEYNNKNNNYRRSIKNVPKKSKSRLNKSKKRPMNSNVSSNNDNYDVDSYDNEVDNHDNYIKTPKNVKPLYEHSKQFENEEFDSSHSVSLSESTEEDEFVFEDKGVPEKPKKPLAVKRKAPPKKKSPKKRPSKVKRPKSPTRKKQSNVPKEESNEDKSNNYDVNENEYSDNQYDSYNENNSKNSNEYDNKNNEYSDDSVELDNNTNNNKKLNTRKSSKNYPAQKTKDGGKSLNKHEKNNQPEDDNNDEQRNLVKNRSIPQNSQMNDDDNDNKDYNDNNNYNDDDNDDDDVFNSQIFDDQMPKIDKYENSANWQQYDQEFALNALFSKIKYNKSV